MRYAWQRRTRRAFTLVEIMIIVALIGLLATLALPSYIKNRKQSQGRRIVNDARVIDGAINQWALETGQTDGNNVDLAAAASYTKTGTIKPNDILGNGYNFSAGVGPSQIVISAATKTALYGVGIDWAAY